LSTVAEVEAARLMSGKFLGNPDGALCEAAKREDDGASTAAAGVGNVGGVVEGLANGDPKIDVAAFPWPWSPMFDTTGADVDAAKGKKDGLAFAAESLGTEEVKVDPKADVPPNAEEVEELPTPNAELVPKLRLPNTFGVVLRLANAEAAGGTGGGAAAVFSGVGIEKVPKAETTGAGDDVPKTEVDDDELAPSMTEGEGLTPKAPVSHSVALGFSGLGWY
jgi:hypothetical protein